MCKNAATIFVIIMSFVLTAFSAIPKMMNYQGMLLDKDGKAVNGIHTIQFAFFGTESQGEAIWTETHSVQVENGLFNVLLGSITSFDEIKSHPDDIFLEIKINNDPPMKPRKQILSVSYALSADNSDHLGGYGSSSYIRKLNNVVPMNGNINLVAGSNVTVTPNPDSHEINISASGGSSGDNLGNHSATQNIRLNSNWISNDGGSEGLLVDNAGNIKTSDDIMAMGKIFSGGNMGCGGNLAVDNHLGVNMGGGYSTLYPLQVNGSAYITVDNVIGGKLMTAGHCGINFGGYSTTYALRVSGNAYCTGTWQASDINMKKNIRTIDQSVEKLKQLRGVSYNWKTEEYTDREFSDNIQYGLIAQEVEKVFPEMVMTDENGEKAIAYYQLIPVLLEALKQQQLQIEDLQQKIGQ